MLGCPVLSGTHLICGGLAGERAVEREKARLHQVSESSTGELTWETACMGVLLYGGTGSCRDVGYML